MHKLTFKNKFGQTIKVHGSLGFLYFIPNEGDPIPCTENEFLKIEKVDKNEKDRAKKAIREHSGQNRSERKIFRQCPKGMPR